MDDLQTYLKNESNVTNFESQLEINNKETDTNITKKLLKILIKNKNDENDPWTITNIENKNNNKYLKKKNCRVSNSIYLLSSFAVTEGVYFYEIEMLQNMFNKKIKMGWIAKLVEIYYSNSQCSLSKDAQSFIFTKTNLQLGDIIGCLVHVEMQKINVYYNGKFVLDNNTKNVFKNLPIFAFTIVKFGQKIRVNFGNNKFKYPPFQNYETFHSKIIQKIPSFQIKIKNNIEWFCTMDKSNAYFNDKSLKVFDYDQNNLKILFRFSDLMQKQFDEKVVFIETMINADKYYEEIANHFKIFFKKLDKTNISLGYRFFQSIVESLGYIIKTTNLSSFHECILFIFDYCFEKLGFIWIPYHSFITNYISIFFKITDTQINNNKNKTKIRYICLILFYLTDNNKPCCKYLKKQLPLFFYHILQHSNDPWSQLYSFISLFQKEDNDTPNVTLKQYLLSLIDQKEKPPFLIWKNSFKKRNVLKNTRFNENSAQLQLYQYLQYYLPETSQTTNDNASNQDFNFEVSNKKTYFFSFFNLMIRNDNNRYETIRYKFSISPPSFYFEVTIVTVGLMKIGLAAKQMNIEEVVGSNSFSIGIDGYNRCVWMHNKAYKFKTFQRHWNAGDVIGVYVDFVNRSVSFGINNKIIEIDGDPFEDEFVFSILQCHVAASLEKNQQCFFNFDCKVIPKAFLKKLDSVNQNIQNVHKSVLICGSTDTGNIAINDISNRFNDRQTLNYDKQLNFIMKSDEASKRSLQTWSTVTEEINQAYGKVLSKKYKGDNRITLNACEQWRNQMESILKDIENPVRYYDKYMRKIGEISRKLKSDAQKPNPKPSPHNQPLMPAPVQLGQNNFSLWLNSLMMALSSEGAVQAVAFPLHEEHPHNLIARGRILLTVPVEMQAPIEQLKVAYEMLQVLRHEYEKNDELSQSSTANVSRKRALLHPDESDPETSVKQRQNQPSTSWAP